MRRYEKEAMECGHANLCSTSDTGAIKGTDCSAGDYKAGHKKGDEGC